MNTLKCTSCGKEQRLTGHADATVEMRDAGWLLWPGNSLLCHDCVESRTKKTAADTAVIACNAILDKLEGAAVALIGNLRQEAIDNPGKINWGHVGSLAHIAELLDEIEATAPEVEG